MSDLITLKSPCVLPILKEIAKEYPQAIYYPFKISAEGLSEQAQGEVKELNALLSNPLLDSFIDALSNLTHPEHRFKDWVDQIRILQSKRDAESIKESAAV